MSVFGDNSGSAAVFSQLLIEHDESNFHAKSQCSNFFYQVHASVLKSGIFSPPLLFVVALMRYNEELCRNSGGTAVSRRPLFVISCCMRCF